VPRRDPTGLTYVIRDEHASPIFRLGALFALLLVVALCAIATWLLVKCIANFELAGGGE